MLKVCKINMYNEKIHGERMRLWQGCPTIAVKKNYPF